jgi:hypothetical protein
VNNKIEQASELMSIAEVDNFATTKSASEEAPLHIAQCLQLIKTPELEAKHELDVRCFYLQDGRVFFAIVFFELGDSFLVGAPARLVQESSKQIVAEPIGPMPVMRFFKSSITGTTKALAKYTYHYYKYLSIKGIKLLPTYLKDDILNQVSDFVQSFVNVDSIEPIVSVVSSVKQSLEKEGIQGVSDKAFTPQFISEKIH